MYVVYKHTTPSGKVYIGITKQKPERRWQNGNGYKENEHFYRAILKYGWDNIKHEIVKDGLTKQQACDLEIELIAEYHATDPRYGYNISTGGECSGAGHKVSAETRRKISEAQKGRPSPLKGTHRSAETRRKIGEANKGRIPWCKGSHLNPEVRRKISESHKGKHPSAETLRKRSESLKGKSAKAIICVETGTVYSSGMEAAKSIGVTNKAISNAVRGVTKTSGGYHWKYAGGEQ